MKPTLGWGEWIVNILLAVLTGLLWNFRAEAGIVFLTFILLNNFDRLYIEILRKGKQ